MKILDLSDLHLSHIDNLIDDDFVTDIREDDRLAELLATKFGTDAQKIIIGGDLVEAYQAIWFGRKRFIKKLRKRYPKTLSIIENDPDIIVLNGNHDDGSLKYLNFVGKMPHNYVELCGFRFEHGHQAEVFFHSKFMCRLSKVLVKVIYALEIFVGKLTRFKFTKFWMDYQRKKRMDGEDLDRYAEHLLIKKKHLSGVVLHHTHIPKTRLKKLKRDEINDNEELLYINCGSYIWGDVLLIDTETKKVKNLVGQY